MNLKQIIEFIHTYTLYNIFLQCINKTPNVNDLVFDNFQIEKSVSYTYIIQKDSERSNTRVSINNIRASIGNIYTNTGLKDREILYTAFKEAKDVSLKIEQVLKNTEKELKEYIRSIKKENKIPANKELILFTGNRLNRKNLFNIDFCKLYYFTKNNTVEQLELKFTIKGKDIDQKYKDININISLAEIINYVIRLGKDSDIFWNNLLDIFKNTGTYPVKITSRFSIKSLTQDEKNALLDKIIENNDTVSAAIDQELMCSPRKNYRDIINKEFTKDITNLKINKDLIRITRICPTYMQMEINAYILEKDKTIKKSLNKEQYLVQIEIFPDTPDKISMFPTAYQYCLVSFNNENELVFQKSYMCERISAWSKDLNVVDMEAEYQNFAEWLVFKALPHINMKAFEKLTNTKLAAPNKNIQAKKKEIMDKVVLKLGIT